MNLSRRDLDSNVVNIELTLVSIIQGVALYFLTENARTALSLNNWPALLYISAGLCVIFIFWSRLTTVYAAFVWLLFVYDVRLIRARLREAANEAERSLYQRTMEDQSLNIRALMPLLFFFNLCCALVINHWLDFFIDRAGNVWLIAAQLLSFLIYLFYVTRFYNRLAPLILHSHEAASQS